MQCWAKNTCHNTTTAVSKGPREHRQTRGRMERHLERQARKRKGMVIQWKRNRRVLRKQDNGKDGIPRDVTFHRTLGSEIIQLAVVLLFWLWGGKKSPLCCHRCKLRVHTERCALTLKGSKKNSFSVFSAHQTALQICITKSKKGRQTSPNWKSLGIIMVCVVWQGWSWDKRQRTWRKCSHAACWAAFLLFLFD